MTAWKLHPLVITEPWSACLIPATFPLKPEQRGAMATFVEAFAQAVEAERTYARHIFLHCWKSHVEGVGERLHQNLDDWKPSFGMGLFPNRKPPARMTQDDLMDYAADQIEGREPERNRYALNHLDAAPGEQRRAVALQFGYGATVQMWSDGDFADMEAEGRKTFLPTIPGPLFRHEGFYLPLFDAAALAAAGPSDLDRWMGRIRLYLRESAEDGGLLIVSRLPLQPLLDQAALQSGVTWNHPRANA